MQNHYKSFRIQYQCTALLWAIAVAGTIAMTVGILCHKHLLGAIVLLITISVSGLLLCCYKIKVIREKKLSLGWRLLFFACACLLLHALIRLGLGGTLPLTSIVLLFFTLLSQITLTLGLIVLAWPTEKHAQLRAFIDSHVVVLALLVMAWTKGLHLTKALRLWNLNLFDLHHQFAYLYLCLLWINTISGVFLMASILFYFIASYSAPYPKRSTLWITAGASLFFLLHVFRTYALSNAGWNHFSDSWFIWSCSLSVYSIIALFAGAVWHEAPTDSSEVKPSNSQINHRLVTLWFPYGVALVVSLLLLINEISSTKKDGSGLLPIVLLLIAILSRQMLTMWDNLQLSEKLKGSNINLENNVMERTQHLAILHSITSTLNSSLDKNSVLTIALEQIMAATNAEQGAIWLRHNNMISPDKAEWHLAYAKGFPSKNHEDALRVLAIETVDDEVILSAKTQSFFQTTYDFPASSGKFLAVPIRSGGLLLGVQALVLKSGKPDYDTRSVVESVALEVGTSLQNAQLYQEARQRADRDGVTNLLNHRAIQEQLTAILRNSQKSGEPFSVLMMDLNDFKYFNDTYGHPVGDDVLRNVAMQLKKIGGTINPVGRYGGDEFIILMPGQNHEHARQTYQTLLETMEQEHFEVAPGVRIPISMSYGWSVFPDDGKSALELITIADANLYRYKQRGELEDEAAAIHRRTAPAGKSTAFGVLDALITAIDNKDHYTRKHSDEVAHYALLIAQELDYSSESLRAVRISGLLHDVGKIAVPDDILRHPGKLSQTDWEIMKQHPTFGALIVKDLPYLEDVISGIRSHHERWDGRGYPDGLSGMQIPVMGRLLAVPDTYSALTTNRPYRKGHTPQEALLEIKRSILTQFDPLIAKTFIEVMKRELGLGDLDDENAVQKVFTNS